MVGDGSRVGLVWFVVWGVVSGRAVVSEWSGMGWDGIIYGRIYIYREGDRFSCMIGTKY